MKRILVLDGGGVKGIMQSIVLCDLERHLHCKMSDMFDLVVGTSVGAILGGLCASGRLSARSVHDIMLQTVPEMFKRARIFPKYSRKALNRVFETTDKLDTIRLGNCATKFICTSVNLCDGRTHYFKSWEIKDGSIKFLDAITRSYAAPLYFGSIVDERTRAVWLDGGTGIANCPLLIAVVEAARQKWLQNEGVHILSVGTGHTDNTMSFEQAKRYRVIRQLLFFMNPISGGLARVQSIKNAVDKTEALAGVVNNFTFQRLDCVIDKKHDRLDGVKYLKEYEKYGAYMSRQVSHAKLV